MRRRPSSDWSLRGTKSSPWASTVLIWSWSKFITKAGGPRHRKVCTWPQHLVNRPRWYHNATDPGLPTFLPSQLEIASPVRPGIWENPTINTLLQNLSPPASDLWAAYISFLHTQHTVPVKSRSLCATGDTGCRWSADSERCLFELLVYTLLFKLLNPLLLFRYAQICEHDYNSPQNNKRTKSTPQYS